MLDREIYPRVGRTYAELRDHVAFYPGKMDECFLDDERVRAQPGNFYSGGRPRTSPAPSRAGRERWDGEPAMTRVAVLGTGIMGAPMARNLAAAGHDVRAWNRRRERAEPLAAHGVEVAGSPEEAVEGAEVVVTMLADGPAVQAATGGLAFPDGAVWAQMSTVGVQAIEALAARAARAGVALVDAPVVGTKAPAEQGKLTVLASGPPEARERCAPVFDAVAARTLALGDEPGAATRMKLVLNAWLLALVEGLAESVTLAERLGADPAAFLEIIDGGPLGPPYAKMKGTMMIERSYEPSFPLALAAKDARLALEAAAACGLELPVLDAIRAQLETAVELGHGDADMAAAVEAHRQG